MKRDWICGKSTWKISRKQGSNGMRSGGVGSDATVVGRWPSVDAWDSMCLRTTSKQWNVPGRCGPYGELFLFLLEKEPMVLRS